MTAAPRRGVSPVVFGAGVWAGVIVSPRTIGSLASSVLLVPVRRALGRSTAASIFAERGAGELLLVVLGRGDGVTAPRSCLFCVLSGQADAGPRPQRGSLLIFAANWACR